MSIKSNIVQCGGTGDVVTKHQMADFAVKEYIYIKVYVTNINRISRLSTIGGRLTQWHLATRLAPDSVPAILLPPRHHSSVEMDEVIVRIEINTLQEVTIARALCQMVLLLPHPTITCLAFPATFPIFVVAGIDPSYT